MKLGELILLLGVLRRNHGDLDVYSRDVMSGVSGAVIPLPDPYVRKLAALTGRQRKRRIFHSPGSDLKNEEAGEAVVIL